MQNTPDDGARAAARAAEQEAAAAHRPSAPDSPRIKTWNRRIMGWGCLPVMVAGMIAVLRVPYAIEIGTGLALLIGGPLAVYALWLRWQNRQAFNAALAAAEASGGRVRTRTDDRGNNVYEVVKRRIEAPVDFSLSADSRPDDSS